MTQTTQTDDEISLLDLFAVLWRRKVLIIVLTALTAAATVSYSLVSKSLPPEKSPMPNVYTPKALLMINTADSGGGGLSSMMNSSGLSSLSKLTGLSISAGTTNAKLAIYLMHTPSFLDAIVDRFDLIERYQLKEYVRAKSRKTLENALKVEQDKDSGVIEITFTAVDPVFATEVVNFTVRLLEERFDAMGLDKNKREKENLEINMANSLDEIKNLQIQAQTFAHTPGVSASTASLEAARLQIELDAQRQVYSQLKVQYELVKVALASEAPIFKILELAEPPDMKSGPRRSLLCLIGTFSAGFLGVLIAFALHAAECFKNDPVAMAKLRGIKRSVS